MARPPEVFVRPVTMTEGRRLQRIGRTAKDPVKLRRAIVVLMSAQGQSAPDIAHLLDCSPEYVRTVIRAFNESGFAALDPKWSGGRPRTIGEQVRREICLLARCCPRDLGLAVSTWSLAKLAEYLASAGIGRISRESIRQILHDAGINWLAAKTWKASTDPRFIEKMHRVLDLYDHPPAGGRVICADEFGPLNLQPRPGRGWRPAGHPARLRDLPSHRRGAAHARRLGPGHREDLLPDPRAQAVAGVPGLPQAGPRALASRHALCGPGQLRPAQTRRSHQLGRRPRRRAGVPADLLLLAELDRTRIRGAALLRAQRHR